MSRYQIRRGADRARTRTGWLDSAHSFSFGSYYDPDELGFGVLQAFNEDLLQPGAGYPVHAHADVEILTWVLAGSLTHRDSSGAETVIAAGQLHHLSAGSGIRHTEASSLPDQPVHLVQMWLAPDQAGLPPLRQLLGPDGLDAGRLVPLAAGDDHPAAGVLRIRCRGAVLSVARLPAGAALALPAAPLGHLYLAAGSAEVRDPAGEPVGELAAGDVLRTTGGGGEQLTAGQPSELLVWQLPAGSSEAGAPAPCR